MRGPRFVVCTVLSVAFAFSCAASPPVASAPAAAARPARGLDAPDNDPRIARAAANLRRCDKPVPDCSEDILSASQWDELNKDYLQDATLINLVEDDHPHVRYMAALDLAALPRQHLGYAREPRLAARLIDALLRERDPYIANYLAGAVGGIDFSVNPALLPRVAAFVEGQADADVRSCVMIGMARGDITPEAFQIVVRAAKSPNTTLRHAAVSALDDLAHDAERESIRDEACAALAAARSDSDSDIRGIATRGAAKFCASDAR